jgi:hypothetical protein
MPTSLKAPLKREIEIGKSRYVVTLAPEGLKLVLKGRRKGYEVSWASLVSGDAALSAALNASLTAPLLPKRQRVPRSAGKNRTAPRNSERRQREMAR